MDEDRANILGCQLLEACKGSVSYPFECHITESQVLALVDDDADVNRADDQGKTALFYAVQVWNNRSVVRALVDGGADVNKTDNEGKTALFYAVHERNNERVVRALVDRGTDVKRIDNGGKTALFYAVQIWKNESVVRALVNGGADVNATDDKGKTALYYAVQQRNNENVVFALIKCGASVNITDNEGKTALFYVVQQRNNKSVVRALVDGGADVNRTDSEGKTVLYYAVQQNNESMVRQLVYGGADVNRADNEGESLLFYAVQVWNNESVVRALVDAGADVNATDNEGKTALFYAITKLDILSYLLDRGANLFLEDNYSVLAFLFEKWYEIPFEMQDSMQILLNKKKVTKEQILKAILSVVFIKILSFNPISYDFVRDPLQELLRVAQHYTTFLGVGQRKAIKKISKKIRDKQMEALFAPETMRIILRNLVKLGASVNSVDSGGNSTLHHAIQLSWRGVPEEKVLFIIYFLTELGASCHLKNRNNETPLVHSLVIILKEISSGSPRQWSKVKTQIAVCKFLMKDGHSSVEQKTEADESAFRLILELLQQALLDKELKKTCLGHIIELLSPFLIFYQNLEIPAAGNVDNRGNTLLHLWAKLHLPPGEDYSISISQGYTFRELVKLILYYLKENRELLHVKNENGSTPLHLCRTWIAVELLLDAGAYPKDLDSSGRTPLLNAAIESKSLKRRNPLYPDILSAPDEFWRTVLKRDLDLWSADKRGESVLSVLIESESHELASSLIDVACEDIKVRSCPLILFSLLTAICRDKFPNAQWKKNAAERILSSTRCPVNGNAKEDSPLHFCCRNILEAEKTFSIDEIKNTVHWSMVTLLRSYGADYRIPDAREQSCLNIAEEFPELKHLLMEPIDIDGFPVLIDRWKSVSKTHERCLAKVARHLESEHVESYWYHKDHLASGSFGAVFAGISEKDGREVAIKRIEKRHKFKATRRQARNNKSHCSRRLRASRFLFVLSGRQILFLHRLRTDGGRP